jgi:hypothetical protein
MRKANVIAGGVVAPPSSAYPAASPYPAPSTSASSFATEPRSGTAFAPAPPSPSELHRAIPTRQILQGAPAPSEPNYAAPPGYVAPAAPGSQFSPVFYTVLGMGVMAVTYMALMVFKPF